MADRCLKIGSAATLKPLCEIAETVSNELGTELGQVVGGQKQGDSGAKGPRLFTFRG